MPVGKLFNLPDKSPDDLLPRPTFILRASRTSNNFVFRGFSFASPPSPLLPRATAATTTRLIGSYEFYEKRKVS